MSMQSNIEPSDPWIGRLSEYVDGELSKRERRRLEEHLPRCPECAAVVEALRRVVQDALALRADGEPSADLWPAIAKRLVPRERKQQRRWWAPRYDGLLPRLAAVTGIAVTAVLMAVLWVRHPVQPAGARPQGPGIASAVTAPVVPAERDEAYDARVAALDREARTRLTLDPRVIDVLEENLATLDAAIANYREALASAPADPDLRARLAAARQQKVDVLQQAVTLATEAAN